MTEAADQPSQPIAKVVWVKGMLKAVQPQQAERKLERRSPVYVNDTLITDAKSTGQVVFTDDSLLALRENTSLQISKYQYGKGIDPSKESYVMSLTKGGLRTITGVISKENPSGYQANTPVATIAVHGTAYSIYYTPGQGGKGLVTKLDQGSIELANKAGKISLNKCTEEKNCKQQCTQEEIKNKTCKKCTPCKDNLYSQVTSENSMPTYLTQMPSEFLNNVNIISTPFGGGSTNPSTGTSEGFNICENSIGDANCRSIHE